jgi:glycerophosphoryl diester phosphodiesterase
MKRALALALAYVIYVEAIENPNAICHVPSIILPTDIEPTLHGQKVVIAHRGASAHMPEHSLEGYRLALEMGADYVEPDLVATKDGQLIAIHSMDLSLTTDVAEKFSDRQTFSKYMNQTGYWSYEFTLEEILTLRIKQRLPEARTQRFDGMFQIPSLTQILELLHEWNTAIDIKRVNTTQDRAVRGVYAELKDYPWLLDDTGHDLVDLFFQHMDDNDGLWQESVIDSHCYTKLLKAHEYRLPPLVIQSFEGDALKYFVNTWDEKFNKNATKPALPAPPTILLVNSDECLADSFWFRVEERYRNILSGIGPDKKCLGYRWREFMQRATKSGLAVHPWTARPELEFLSEPSSTGTLPFANVLEELQYFLCVVGVHGIFSESVDAAVLASTLPCPPTATGGNKRSKGGGVCENFCSESTAHTQFFVGFTSFVMGIIIALLVMYVVQGIKLRPLRSGRRERIPTEDLDANIQDKANVDDDSAFSSQEMEML